MEDLNSQRIFITGEIGNARGCVAGEASLICNGFGNSHVYGNGSGHCDATGFGFGPADGSGFLNGTDELENE
jgi:hypothetical protein